MSLWKILEEARACTVCASSLPFGPRPLLAASPLSRILIIGQAPGKTAHQTGIPWQDRSGDRLRDWLGVGRDRFYNPDHFALIPTGFCYPGSAKSGDLPPRPECAPLWHPQIIPQLMQVELTIYLGGFAFASHLGERYKTLSDCGGLSTAAPERHRTAPSFATHRNLDQPAPLVCRKIAACITTEGGRVIGKIGLVRSTPMHTPSQLLPLLS